MNSYFDPKTGKWIYRESYVDYLTGKRKRVSVSLPNHSRATQRLARELLDKRIEEAGKSRENGNLSLSELFEDYINDQKKTVKASTWMRNEYTIRPVVEAIGEDALCSRLNAATLIKALTGSNTTINQRLMRFKAMIRWGYKHDYLDDIRWLDKVEKKPEMTERKKIADKYLESEDLTKLINGMDVEKWRLLTQFLALTGLRLGEAVALNNTDVDSVIRVTKTFDPRSKIITSPKSFDSNREVFIQKELKPIIARIRRWRLMNVPRSKKFFPDYGDVYLSHAAYEKYFRENTERILGRRLTPHSLRHTHASLCFEQGMTIEAVSARLGHSDSKITKEIYLHITEKKKDIYNRQMDNVRLFS